MKVEKLVRFALLNNPKVIDVIAKTTEGIPLVGINHNPVGKYPLIELHSTSGRAKQFADDRVYTNYNVVEINFHCKNDEYGKVSEEIDDMMFGLGFIRINYYSTRNQYTNVVEYTISYRATFDTAMLDRHYTEQFEMLEFPEEALSDQLESSSQYLDEDGQPIDLDKVWKD